MSNATNALRMFYRALIAVGGHHQVDNTFSQSTDTMVQPTVSDEQWDAESCVLPL